VSGSAGSISFGGGSLASGLIEKVTSDVAKSGVDRSPIGLLEWLTAEMWQNAQEN